MKSQAKGQAAVEFYSYLIFFLLIFTVSVWIYYDYVGKATEQKQYKLVEQVAAHYAMPIDMAVRFGDGYNGYFKPVKNPLVKVNNVWYDSGFVTINWTSVRSAENYYSYPMLTKNFNHTMTNPLNCMNITNDNDSITVVEWSC